MRFSDGDEGRQAAYADAVVRGHEARLQEGFDHGLNRCRALAMAWGCLQGHVW
jgi:hypothetical protein